MNISPADLAFVRQKYDLGFSVREIAPMLTPPVHWRTLFGRLQRAGFKTRTQIESNRSDRSRQLRSLNKTNRRRASGADSPRWKGDAASTHSGRRRAQAMYPIAPTECPCERWAAKMHRHHKDGNTHNNAPENIAWLCPRCHKRQHPNPTGERHWNAKLTQAQADTLRRLATKPSLSTTALAAEFGISPRTALRIIRMERYRPVSSE